MSPRLFDTIWEAYRMVGARQPVTVLSSYRSPRTNSMLRSRSRAVAKNSQHMYGRAMDMRFPGVNMHRVREAGIKLQYGGVGWYPRSGFVHLDVGSVRAWPRMSYSQLAHLFPDGKTVHVSTDGRTLPGYEEARSMVASRTGAYVPTLAQARERGFLERLFGWGDGGDEPDQNSARRDRRQVASAPAGRAAPAVAENNSAASFFRRDRARLAARQQPDTPAPVAVVARAQPVAAPQPDKASNRADLVKLPPPPSREAAVEKQPDFAAPLPPRRPSESQLAALIDNAVPDVPLPPQRPEDLIVVAEQTAPLPPDSRGRLAALIGSNAPGAIAAKSGLPSVITSGKPAGSASGAPDVMAFASPVVSDGPARTSVKVRKVALRQTMPASAPALARTIGVRAASKQRTAAAPSQLVAARLDRSNFGVFTRPSKLEAAPVHTLLGPALVALRPAARSNPAVIMFGPQDSYTTQFVRQKVERVQVHQRFSALGRQ